MPPQIGDIISELVYENKLKSNPSHPIRADTTACYFVEALGKEKSMGNSLMVLNIFFFFFFFFWIILIYTCLQNEAEASHILHIARKLQEQDRNYRIITPYSSQRNYIEKLMKREGLRWGDKCFTVDSFQGNFSLFSLMIN